MLKLKDIIGKLTWSSIASLVYILVQALVFLYLSHHLSATDFGIFTIAASLILFGINIVENGMPQSIIQTDKPLKEDYNAVLFLNLKAAIYYSVVMFFILIPIIIIWENKTIIYPTLSLLPCLFLASYNKVQLVGLQKNLQFKSIAKVEIISSFAYLLTVAIAIYFDLGIWILILSFLAKYFSVFISLQLLNFIFSENFFTNQKSITQKHNDFGKYIQGEKIVTSIISYADVFIVSATLGVEILGFYDVLKRVVLRPVVLLYNGAEQLFYPLFVKAKNDTNQYLDNYSFLNKLSKYFFINLTCILYLCSPFIIKLLPETYVDFLPTLKLLCLFAAVVVVMNPIDILLYSFGKSKLFFNWILSYTLPLLLVIYYTSTYNLNTMLIGLILFYALLYLISYFALIKKTFIPKRSYFDVFGYTVLVYFLLVQFT